MTLTQAKAILIVHCTKISGVSLEFISDYINGCTEETFKAVLFKGLMKIAGVEI